MDFFGQPISVDDSCAAAGISDGCVVVRGIMPHASVYRNVLRSADARFGLIEPG